METDYGGTNCTNIWKEMRKAYPKKSKPLPTGVLNVVGKVITNPKEKKIVTLDHFSEEEEEEEESEGRSKRDNRS